MKFGKMAAINQIEQEMILSFVCDHLMVESVSTLKFRLMCQLHTPVYLFANLHEQLFIKWDFGVSGTLSFLKKI